MSDFELPEEHKDTAWEDLPPDLQRQVYRQDPSVDDTPHPAAQPMDENASANLEDVPEGASFPYHKGGGWYTLSDGTSVQGEEAATEQQSSLDG